MKWLAKHKKELMLLVFSIFFVLLIAEVAVRLFVPSVYVDPELGWAWRDAASVDHNVRDNTTVNRTVTAQYFEHGFKRWGDVNTNKTKAFIIGDSFTEMWYVNNGEEWYSYLEKAFPQTEFFVYGVGGWGSLQEYLLLKSEIDEIKPDMILWQFHYNDFVNNYYPADRRFYPLNNRQVRPYLEKGKIVYKVPAPFGWARLHSRLAALILEGYDGIRYREVSLNQGPFFLNILGGSYNQTPFTDSALWGNNFTAAYKTTESIFSLVNEKTNVPIYFFSADDKLLIAEHDLCGTFNMTYIGGVRQAVDAAANLGEEVRIPDDGHWNLRGNQIAGEFLVNYFQKREILH